MQAPKGGSRGKPLPLSHGEKEANSPFVFLPGLTQTEASMSKKTRATGTGGHNCSVADCQNPDKNIFIIPSGDANVRNSWIHFIFNGNVPVAPASNLFVCATHFSPDSFSNLGQYNAGLAKTLRLERGVVPNIRDPTTTQHTVITGIFSQTLPAVRHVACQTDPPETRPLRSVGTQLSMKTLQSHFRSIATQAKTPSRDCGVCTPTFPLDSPLLLLQPTVVKIPSKRPRLTEEEEGP